MDEQERFVIPISVVGGSENVSSETIRRLAKRLERDGVLTIQSTPYGRGFLNIPGYRRLREAIHAGNKAT